MSWPWRLSQPVQAAPVIDTLDDLLESSGGLGAYDRTDQVSDAFLDAELKQLRGMALILPPIFLPFLVSLSAW